MSDVAALLLIAFGVAIAAALACGRDKWRFSMPNANPTLGRIVLYGDEGGTEHPAIVTGTDADRVNLTVFFDMHGIQVRRRVAMNPDPATFAADTWRWPPRAP